MSMATWVIHGIGLCANDIEPYIDNKKLTYMLREQLPDDEDLLSIIASEAYDNLNLDDYLYGYPFDNIADVLCFCDNTDTITYGDDGEGRFYFYYPMSMPWERSNAEPKSIEEVHERIIAAVKKITTLSYVDIDKMIDDDLYVIGMG